MTWDRKFAPQADRVFRSEGARLIITPLMAPKANAHAERWIGSCRRECLDRMLILNQRHLEIVLREYGMHYNEARPHRSRSLRPPASRGEAPDRGPGRATDSAGRSAHRVLLRGCGRLI